MIMLLYMLCLFFLIYIFTGKGKESYFISIIIWNLTAYTINEFLSFGGVLEYSYLMLTYLVITILVLVLCVYQLSKRQLQIPRVSFVGFSNVEKGVVLAFFLFSIFIVGMSIVTVPYNWDSHTYHLSRIAYWAQNKSVAHYATNNIRQVTSPVLAEFVNLQVYILNKKSDLFFNVLQATSYVTNTVLIIAIGEKLGISKLYRWLSAFLFVSMPIAFGEALTTQVDHFATLWLLLFVYFLMDFLDEQFHFSFSKEVLVRVLVLGACIGLGYLTKPSILFAVLGFAIWLLCVTLKRKDKLLIVCTLVLVAGTEIVFIVLPEILRNIATFHAISSPIAGARQLVGTMNPLYLLVNGLKNLTMNLPNIYFPWIADLASHIVFWIAYKLNLDINYEAISEGGITYGLHEPQTYGHDTAINPIIFILTLLVIVWLIKKRICKQKYNFLDVFSWTAIGVFVLFCVFLRWEGFVTRYMLSYLALLCPVVAGQMESLAGSHIKISRAMLPIIVFLCAAELSGLIQYHGKICMMHLDNNNRIEGYFTNREGRTSYIELGKILSGKSYRNLGVYLGADTYEYPILKLVAEDVRVEAVNVVNETSMYLDYSFMPEYIVVIDRNPQDVLNYNGKDYEITYVIDDMVYILQVN